MEQFRRGAAAGFRWPRLLTFVGLAYLGGWLVVLPLWLGAGLRSPLAVPLMTLMMFMPAVSAVVAVKLFPDGRKLVDALALRPGPFRRWWWTLLFAWLVPPLLMAISLALAVALGVFSVDLGGWSGYREALAGQQLPMPLPILVTVTLVAGVLAAPFVNTIFASGEEIGWRGFLRGELSRLPRWAVIVLTGVIWGLWHAPIILLGYNYPTLPPIAALGFMVVFTTLLSAVLEWLRTAGTAVWPCALAHGSLNAIAGVGVVVYAAGSPPDTMTVGLLGWTGWIVMAVFVLVLVLTGQLRLRDRPADEARDSGPFPPAPLAPVPSTSLAPTQPVPTQPVPTPPVPTSPGGTSGAGGSAGDDPDR